MWQFSIQLPQKRANWTICGLYPQVVIGFFCSDWESHSQPAHAIQKLAGSVRINPYVFDLILVTLNIITASVIEQLDNGRLADKSKMTSTSTSKIQKYFKIQRILKFRDFSATLIVLQAKLRKERI